MNLTAIFRMLAALLFACTAVSCGSNTGGAVNLEQIATKTRAISVYYTEYTDATFASNDEMKRSALYSTQMDCWPVCQRYTRGIIEHLSAAKPISCPSMFGTRYLLVEFSGGDFKVDINYLKGGNIVVFGKKCYYNEQSIDEVIPSPEIWRTMMRDKNLLNAVQREVYRAEKKSGEGDEGN